MIYLIFLAFLIFTTKAIDWNGYKFIIELNDRNFYTNTKVINTFYKDWKS